MYSWPPYQAPAVVEEPTFTDSLNRLSETYPQIEDIKENY